MVYRTTGRGGSEVQQYVGLTANTFKKRFAAHKQSSDKPEERTKTTLAGYIWHLKDKKITPEISWEIGCRAAPFPPVTGVCNLYTNEDGTLFLNQILHH